MSEKKTPQIRFKGFAGNWQERELGEVAEKVAQKNTELLFTETFTNSAEYGIVSQRDFFDHDITNIDNIHTYYIVESEDFVYNPRISNFAPVGPVNRNKLNRSGVMSPLYTVFRPRGIINSFLEYFFKSEAWYGYMRWHGDSGARSDRFSIKDHQFFKMPVRLASVKEQTRIGEFFKTLDNLISSHQRKYDKLRQVKKSLLEKMFPQQGATQPQIRFNGFNDDWEVREFDELAEFKKGPFGSAITKDMFVKKSDTSVKVYEQQHAINKNEHLERYFISQDHALKLNSFEVEAGDIIVSCAGTIGEIYELPENSEKGVINQALMRIRVKATIINKKLFSYLFSNMIERFSIIHSNGSAMKNIPPFADLKPTKVLIPNKQEQNKLTQLLKTLDELISAHQRELDKLKSTKKALLEKMFV